MSNLNRVPTLLTASFAVVISAISVMSTAQAKSVAEVIDAKDQVSILKSSNREFYDQAQENLTLRDGNDDYYVLYRIVERMARANRLDDRPWRVTVVPEYDINAFATNVNLLAFFNGLMDQIHGDPNALACVVGHEMAHHTEQHIALSAAQREMRLQELRQEAIDEVAAEEEDLSDDLQEMAAGEWIASGVGTIADRVVSTGGLGGLVGRVVSGQIRRDRQRRLEAAAERIQQIAAEKEAQFLAEETERSHSNEFEADEIGYQYMVRAGFDPQGCITVMEAISRIPGSQTAGITHPSTPDRIAALWSMSTTYPTASLRSEGDANIAANPNALTYGLSRDRMSLRIDSRSGSMDIDDLLPE